MIARRDQNCPVYMPALLVQSRGDVCFKIHGGINCESINKLGSKILKPLGRKAAWRDTQDFLASHTSLSILIYPSSPDEVPHEFLITQNLVLYCYSVIEVRATVT